MDSQAVVVFFDDCCNEFWMISTYIVKGICRGELPYAAYHMEAVVRPQLLTMLSWKIGTETSFDYSLGKHYKCIRRYLTGTEWREHTAWTKPEPAASRRPPHTSCLRRRGRSRRGSVFYISITNGR